ncbi:hypothetical protein BsIDN1_37030 [Bacillus safensis]|uniref:2-oxoglutarate dehydrogenase E1 component/KDG C-terminal domain-containing protein n=1 Tax=Bacillus safensis TaxID=561879 RepID=A0A5S9MB38_BACIA|nr:hypothetical protein BsIDN1_37030 [Bacillus safensis]
MILVIVLLKWKSRKDWLHVARVEQLYPFPAKDIKGILTKLTNLEEIVWVQEEPQNMGAWGYIEPYLREIAPEKKKSTLHRPKKTFKYG